ncbi:pre-mod(mdg4)-V [Cochliomyia hominivorax]
MVIPLNRYHTHEEIVRRKKRVRKNIPTDKVLIKSEPLDAGGANSASTTAGSGGIDVSTLGMHLKYEEIVADVTEIVEPSPIVITKK